MFVNAFIRTYRLRLHLNIKFLLYLHFKKHDLLWTYITVVVPSWYWLYGYF